MFLRSVKSGYKWKIAKDKYKTPIYKTNPYHMTEMSVPLDNYGPVAV